MSEADDADLVSRAASGERAAFETLLRRRYDRIHRIAWRLTGSSHDADDITTPIDRSRESERFEQAPQEARFATAVAAFGEMLRGGTYTGALGFDDVARMAAAAKGDDPFGYRAEFVQLVRAAKTASALAAPR